MRLIAANGVQTAASVMGDGPPIVLMHGAEGTHAMFGALTAHLSQSFTVIAYDQRDCGATENGTAAYTLDDLADDAAALIAALGWTRAHVLGQSFGGQIAQLLALRHPDRVDRLILCGTFQLGTDPRTLPGSELAGMMACRMRGPEGAGDLPGFFFPPAYLAAHPEAAAIFAGPPRPPAQQQRRGAAMMGPVVADAAATRAPTLVIAGAADRLIPSSHAATLSGAIPGAQTLLLDGAGHIAPIQAAETVADAVRRFIAEASADV